MRMCKSALDLADNPSNIEFCTFHDNDDKAAYEYVGNHKEIYGERSTLSEMINKAQSIATGDLYMLVADDFVFETKGWDTIIIEEMDKYPDRIALLYTNDKYYRSNVSQIYCVHRNWVDILGYFVPHNFKSQFIDNWMSELSDLVGRRIFLRQVVVKHYHVLDDEVHTTYLRRKKGDRAYFHATEELRKRDAEKLKDFINSYNYDGALCPCWCR